MGQTSLKLSLLYLSFSVIWVPGDVHAGRPVGLPESTVKLVSYKNGVSKAVITGVWSSFVVSKYHAV